MNNKIKCKKCHLEYDRKKYECPYCHLKRFNPTGLIILTIMIIVSVCAIYIIKGNDITSIIKGMQSNKTFTKDNVIYTVSDIKNSENILTGKCIILKIDIENKNKTAVDVSVKLSSYVDEYLSEDILPQGIKETIQSGMKFQTEYYITTDEDWKEIKVYGEFGNTSELMFKIMNNEE